MHDSRPAVFLDRDGCINVEDDHIRDIRQFRLYPDSLSALKKLHEAGFLLVVITNQSGVARGYFTEKLIADVHTLLRQWTSEAGVHLDAIEYCPHHPDGVLSEYSTVCECRKPAPGMLLRVSEKLGGIDFSRSFVMGDKMSDTELGPVVGARSILLRTGFGVAQEKKIRAGESAMPDHIANGIGDAVDWILANRD